MSGGVTTNYGLKKPNFNARPWDSDVNSNWDLIDSILYTLTQIPNIGGVWRNSTQYTAGQNVLDAQSLVFYQCVVSNVSAATGSFADDRTANPAKWTITTAGQGVVRYDQGQSLTAGQIQQALTNLAAYQTFLRFDAVQSLTTGQLVQALANLQLSGVLKYDGAQTLTYQQILQVLNNLLIDGTESILTATATTDIGNAGSQNVRIDGTTTIISFGARPNKYKLLRFTGSLTLTNSASLILPTGQNIQTQAGDTCIATSDANNNWYIRAYQRADGTAINIGAQTLSANGYKRIPGGITIQWGIMNTGNSDLAIVFPVAFSASAYSVVGSMDSNSAATAAAYVSERDGITATGFNHRGRGVSSGGSVGPAGVPMTWFAVGPT